MKRLYTYWHVWLTLSANALQETFVNRGSNFLFFLGKVIRLFMSVVFLLLIQKTIKVFAGYSVDQVLIFFLTYNLIDTLVQTIYRGVYMFSWQVRQGEFDFTLTKPINVLFVTLLGKPDINDAIFLIPTLIISGWLVSTLHLTYTLTGIIWYLILFANGMLIATAFHILALVVGLLATEVDGVMWLYRGFSRLSQFPVTIYLAPIRLALFFILPFGMMVTIPAQALLGLPLSYSASIAILLGVVFFLLSLVAWKYALRNYSSAGG